MLGVRNYTKDYIDACRSRVKSDLSAYRNLVAAVKNDPAAVEAFEVVFFNNMVLMLDHLFVHRLRTVEGKDTNPLNEVRMLCDSMLNNKNKLRADNTVKYDPAKSVLKYSVGDAIMVKEADFLRLFKAFFAEMESKFL